MVAVIEAVTSYDWFHPEEIDAAKSGRDLEGVQPQQNAMKQRLVGIEREVRRPLRIILTIFATVTHSRGDRHTNTMARLKIPLQRETILNLARVTNKQHRIVVLLKEELRGFHDFPAMRICLLCAMIELFAPGPVDPRNATNAAPSKGDKEASGRGKPMNS